jgi:hypothetical protein
VGLTGRVAVPCGNLRADAGSLACGLPLIARRPLTANTVFRHAVRGLGGPAPRLRPRPARLLADRGALRVRARPAPGRCGRPDGSGRQGRPRGLRRIRASAELRRPPDQGVTGSGRQQASPGRGLLPGGRLSGGEGAEVRLRAVGGWARVNCGRWCGGCGGSACWFVATALSCGRRLGLAEPRSVAWPLRRAGVLVRGHRIVSGHRPCPARRRPVPGSPRVGSPRGSAVPLPGPAEHRPGRPGAWCVSDPGIRSRPPTTGGRRLVALSYPVRPSSSPTAPPGHPACVGERGHGDGGDNRPRRWVRSRAARQCRGGGGAPAVQSDGDVVPAATVSVSTPLPAAPSGEAPAKQRASTRPLPRHTAARTAPWGRIRPRSTAAESGVST